MYNSFLVLFGTFIFRSVLFKWLFSVNLEQFCVIKRSYLGRWFHNSCILSRPWTWSPFVLKRETPWTNFSLHSNRERWWCCKFLMFIRSAVSHWPGASVHLHSCTLNHKHPPFKELGRKFGKFSLICAIVYLNRACWIASI